MGSGHLIILRAHLVQLARVAATISSQYRHNLHQNNGGASQQKMSLLSSDQEQYTKSTGSYAASQLQMWLQQRSLTEDRNSTSTRCGSHRCCGGGSQRPQIPTWCQIAKDSVLGAPKKATATIFSLNSSHGITTT